jgi:membrane fusion protein
MNQPLFRPEVVAERQTQWLGTVLLAPRPSHRLFTAFAVLAGAAILSLLYFGEYTRKARINGWLVPHQGLVQVFAPQAGVVMQLLAREGMKVRKGMPLMILSTELQSAALGATQEEIVRHLASRRDSLVGQRTLQHELLEQQKQALADRLAALQDEQEQLAQQVDLQRDRLKLAQQSLGRLRPLHKSGFVSDLQIQEDEATRLDQALKLRDLGRNQEVIKSERMDLEGQLRELPVKSRMQVAEIDREIAALEQELAGVEARRRIVIPAPEDGTVTAIQVALGGTANVTAPLLSIVPADSKLDAHLLAPSRAIGFLRSGQHVLLRYQAYPYQKFGQYHGVVATISRSAISPGELPPQLSGLTSLYATNEPVYRITVTLASQAVTAYGKAVPLQPGMQLEADVVLESRRLYEWVLDPLYTLTGKWQG